MIRASDLVSFNLGVLMSRQAYNDDPNSTHRQRDDYTKEQTRDEADES